MAKIFISYRRSDSAYVAATLNDKLQHHFGPDSVFFDVDNIPLGVDFREYIENAVGQCDVLLVIIGDQWLESVDDQGKRRLDEPSDYVRVEIESALKRNIPLIPILVGEVEMPSADDLPPSIQSIVFRNAAELRAGRDLRQHIDLLIRGLEPICGSKPPPESLTITNRDAAAVAQAQASEGAKDRLELLEEIETILDGFTDRFLFVGDTIPSNKLNSAISSYAAGLSREDVLLLYDNTTLGGAKTGVLLTADTVYWDNGWGYEPEQIHYKEILKLETKLEASSSRIQLNEKTINIQKAQSQRELAEALASVIHRLTRKKPIAVSNAHEESTTISDRDAAGVTQAQTSEVGKDRPELLEEIETILHGFTDSSLFVGDTIPSKKLTNAICSYAAKVSREDVLLLYDNTAFGGAKNGVLLTADTVYWDNGWGDEPGQIHYKEILKVETKHEASCSRIQLNEKIIDIMHAGNHRKLARSLASVIRRLTRKEIFESEPPPKSITEEIENILDPDGHLFVGDKIPASKLVNAINSYASNVSPKDVLLLYDGTLFGNAKDGLILTSDAVYWRHIRDPEQVRYVEILHVEAVDNSLCLNEKVFPIYVADGQTSLAKSLANVIRHLTRK